MTILWLRFLDWSGSAWRRYWKHRALKKKWGNAWFDMSRTGRVYTRVAYVPADQSTDVSLAEVFCVPPYVLRDEPGWEWTCQQCKEYSIITESMMPAILKEWSEMADDMVKRGYKAPRKPTAATIPCTNCRFTPGSPE